MGGNAALLVLACAAVESETEAGILLMNAAGLSTVDGHKRKYHPIG